MRNFRTEGIIVKRRNLGEADRLLTVFTKEHGKLIVKASGVRKITSRRSPHIELLNHAVLHLYKGNGFPILTEVQTIENFSPIKQDLKKVGYAYHICELIDGLCPENQEHNRAFFLLRNMLTQLSKAGFVRNDELDIQDYTIGTYGIGVSDAKTGAAVNIVDNLSSSMEQFEVALLTEMGYWDNSKMVSKTIDMQDMIENILERKLKSRNIFSKLD